VFLTQLRIYRISEKVATPTSVILMAINTITGISSNVQQLLRFGDFSNFQSLAFTRSHKAPLAHSFKSILTVLKRVGR